MLHFPQELSHMLAIVLCIILMWSEFNFVEPLLLCIFSIFNDFTCHLFFAFYCCVGPHQSLIWPTHGKLGWWAVFMRPMPVWSSTSAHPVKVKLGVHQLPGLLCSSFREDFWLLCNSFSGLLHIFDYIGQTDPEFEVSFLSADSLFANIHYREALLCWWQLGRLQNGFILFGNNSVMLSLSEYGTTPSVSWSFVCEKAKTTEWRPIFIARSATIILTQSVLVWCPMLCCRGVAKFIFLSRSRM